MQENPMDKVKEKLRNRGVARRELDGSAGRVVVASGQAILWIIGKGVVPLHSNPDGSMTFPDHDDRASKAYDEYLRLVANRGRRPNSRETSNEQGYKQGYLDGWKGAIEAMLVLMQDENLSPDEAYSECIDHAETALTEWLNGSGPVNTEDTTN